MTTAADPIFVDSNILIYSSVQSAPLHGVARAALWTLRNAGSELWISRQVLREYLAALSRPQSYTSPLGVSTLIRDVQNFEKHYRIADEDATITANLLSLLHGVPVGGKQIHDANIVATMQAHGVNRLLTHNVGDFSRFASTITVMPL